MKRFLVVAVGLFLFSIPVSPPPAGQPSATAPSPPGAPPTTVTVPPGEPLPVRQWVERLVPMQSGWADSAVLPPVELRGLGPSKHTRTFYHPGLKGLVVAGGDRGVSMPRAAGGEGTGTEIILLDVRHDRWAMVRPFCVPGEPQPGRPDNVVWVLDKKRNRALMAPGFYFISQGTDSGCGAIDGWGGYGFDFATRKFIGPDDPTIMVPPPGGWGGDEGAAWGVIDLVTDELVRVVNQRGLERMHLETKKWRVNRLNTLSPHRSQPVIDEVGRAVYFLQPSGIPNDPRPQLLKVFLDRPGDFPQESIPLPWLYAPYDGEVYLVFDSVKRVVLIPNNTSMGESLQGLGIYHVDTRVWEWEPVPPNVAGSLWSFDESLGAVVGMGKRFSPYAYYLYRYGGPIKALPAQPSPPPVAKVPVLTETFNTVLSANLGPRQKWTVVEGALRVVNQQCTFATDQQWSSARVEADLPSSDMEVWATSVVMEISGTFTIELQMGVAARYDAASATYYAAALVGSDGYYLRLYKVVAGVPTKLGKDVPLGDYQPGSEIRLRVTGTGPAVTITGLYRGKERLSVTDRSPDRITTGLRAGVIGLGLGALTRGYRWALDDWKAAIAVSGP